MTAFGQVQCWKCTASTASQIGGEHVLPADPNWTFVRGENGIEFICPQCQMEQGDTEENMDPHLSNKLVAALVKRQVRNKLNDILSELKREFGGTLTKEELYTVAHYTLQVMLTATDEFVSDMKVRLERDRKASPSVAARGRKSDDADLRKE